MTSGRFPVFFKLSRSRTGALRIGSGDAGIAKAEFLTLEEAQDLAQALPRESRVKASEAYGGKEIRTVIVDSDGGVK